MLHNVHIADSIRPPVKPARSAATAKALLQGKMLTQPPCTECRGQGKLDSGVPKTAQENNPRERERETLKRG